MSKAHGLDLGDETYVTMRSAASLVSGHNALVQHEWIPRTPEDLRRHARKLQVLAAFVHRDDTALRLREHAAELLAEAELKEATAHP